MSAAATKLSPALKALISAPHARGAALPAPSKSVSSALFSRISSDGQEHGLGLPSWLCLSTASLVTINSPAALCDLYDFATEKMTDSKDKAGVAAIMRETGLKCISFSGIPRTINNLGALRARLGDDVIAHLSTQATRRPTPANIESISSRAHTLWNAIYDPHSAKLLAKLSDSHPDLPVHILNSHYGALLSDPSISEVPPFPSHAKIGRVLTSVVAMSCLRAQQGVGPQVTSHVFGLKKSLLEGGGAEGEARLDGQEWLTSDEGAQWVLRSVDDIVETVAGGVSSFAGPPAAKAKL
ncbi:hypothetical protein QFC19_008618 [Naganishia cerealis]|uniref:Uncharacterized protein n=1 Tax=Naganishia cerealis TaxID=610337 RepID=A0ACC2V107_9TREE|nr:hypothetical protein QFC19_008618 [Naganishia cerealis]